LPLEFIMNHLRLKKGFSLETYTQRTGLAAQSLQPALGHCVEQGLLLGWYDPTLIQTCQILIRRNPENIE
jgi:hypothetical protein